MNEIALAKSIIVVSLCLGLPGFAVPVETPNLTPTSTATRSLVKNAIERLFANPASVTDAKISQTVAITAFEQPAQLVCIETDAQTRSGLRLGLRKMGVVLIDDKVVNIIERDKSCANLPATAWANWGDFNAVNPAAFNVAANRDSNQPNGQ